MRGSMGEDSHSLGSRAFHTIRENILSGKYQPNEELKEKTIGEELGVSRTPVREALRQLELEGLVSIIPNKGAYVVGITQKDMQDIYEIRDRLEGLCAKWAATNITKEQLDELEEIVFLAEFHAKKGNAEQLVELDDKFHETLYKASNSKELGRVLSDFHHYLQRVRKVTLKDDARAKESNKEHMMIVEALKERNADLAERLASEHIFSTASNMERIGWDALICEDTK